MNQNHDLSIAVNFIKQWEGLSLTAYWDGLGDVWTIGYGTTGPDIHGGLTWTLEQCEDRLASDIAAFSQSVIQLLSVQVNDNQLAALISFAYNLGASALASSTLLALLNQGDFQGAAAQFPRWDHSGSQVVQGLLNRRNAEMALFLS